MADTATKSQSLVRIVGTNFILKVPVEPSLDAEDAIDRVALMIDSQQPLRAYDAAHNWLLVKVNPAQVNYIGYRLMTEY